MRLKKRMVATKKVKVKAKAKKAAATNSIDVKGAADIPGITDILKKNKFVIVLVWADYCGHCHTYKDQVWNKLLANKNRRAGLASIHYDQLENAPAPIPKKVSGYPTVLFVGKNGIPTEYSKSRDLEKMSRIVESEEPESLVEELNNNTPALTPDAEERRDETEEASPEQVLNSISKYEKNLTPKKRVATPNPMQGDMLNSQSPETNKLTNVEDDLRKKQGGGSLYRALLEMMRFKQTRSVKTKRGKKTRRSSR